jgi:hypothetical protein
VSLPIESPTAGSLLAAPGLRPVPAEGRSHLPEREDEILSMGHACPPAPARFRRLRAAVCDFDLRGRRADADAHGGHGRIDRNSAGCRHEPAGNVYFASDDCVFKLDTDGVLTRVAGNSRSGYSGDGGPATSAQFYGPWVAVDGVGNLYIADAGTVTAGGIISTLTIPAGLGTGEVPLAAMVGGAQTQSGVVISLQ